MRRLPALTASVFALVVGGAVFASALAADKGTVRPYNPMPFVSELRFGVFDHDRWSPEGDSVDLNAEVLFAKPVSVKDPLWALLIPRPHVGGTLNTAGRTSHMYAGFTWGADIYKGLFVEASFGGAVHNGSSRGGLKQNALGCHVLFRESGSIGYKINQAWSVMATVEHLSNAGLCDQNRGLTNIGARVGYSF